jgi:ribosomal protein S18
MDNKTVNIDWLIAKIDYELSQSTLSRYITTTGKQISTDVGYVEDW